MSQTSLDRWKARRSAARSRFDTSVASLPHLAVYLQRQAAAQGLDPLTDGPIVEVRAEENGVRVTCVTGAFLSVDIDRERAVTLNYDGYVESYLGIEIANDACQLVGPTSDVNARKSFSLAWELWLERAIT